MFNFLKKTASSFYQQLTGGLQSLFSKHVIDQEDFKKLETLLIKADVGVETTRFLLNAAKKQLLNSPKTSGADLRITLKNELVQLIKPYRELDHIYLLVGINGSGKTSFAAKLAHYLTKQHKLPLLAAADTFRAAGAQQLQEWADRHTLPIITGSYQQDPGAVVYRACTAFKQDGYNVLIIDTAGRLQNKTPLMHEIEKIKKIIAKQLPEKKITVLLTIDAMLGQNSFNQAQLFHEALNIDGIVLTKIDSSAKGGMILSINQALHIPIAFVSYGEGLDTLAPFKAESFIDQLLH